MFENFESFEKWHGHTLVVSGLSEIYQSQGLNVLDSKDVYNKWFHLNGGWVDQNLTNEETLEKFRAFVKPMFGDSTIWSGPAILYYGDYWVHEPCQSVFSQEPIGASRMPSIVLAGMSRFLLDRLVDFNAIADFSFSYVENYFELTAFFATNDYGVSVGSDLTYFSAVMSNYIDLFWLREIWNNLNHRPHFFEYKSSGQQVMACVCLGMYLEQLSYDLDIRDLTESGLYYLSLTLILAISWHEVHAPFIKEGSFGHFEDQFHEKYPNSPNWVNRHNFDSLMLASRLGTKLVELYGQKGDFMRQNQCELLEWLNQNNEANLTLSFHRLRGDHYF
jgi:hypothetical protein